MTQHLRFPQRQPRYSAQMVFKLAGHGTFDRPVTGIVNSRRYFVGKQVTVAFKQLNCQNANVVESFEDAPRGVFGFLLQRPRKLWGGSEREPKNSAAVTVFHQRIKCRL